MTQGALQAALPREMPVDERTRLAGRETVPFGRWFCVGRAEGPGLSARSRVVVATISRAYQLGS